MAISSSAVSPSVSLSNPYSLLTLTGAGYPELSAERCHGAQVHQQSGPSRKRKRSEFAIAVDGHGVSVIDVQAPRIISTYSAPPTTRFTCSPLSVKSSSGSTRWTYAAISSSDSLSLSAWKEQATRRGSRTNSVASSPISEFGPLDTDIDQYTRPLKGSSAVISLHSLGIHTQISDNAVLDDILVVSEDATLQCLSADLQVERWIVNNRNTPSHRTLGPLLLASTVPVSTARKTLLKNRLEVLAGYQSKLGDCVLVTVNATRRKENNVEATIYLISNTSTVGNVRKLAHIKLATTGEANKNQFAFHAPTGTLFRRSSQSVSTYDLSKLAPESESLLDISSQISSILPTSSNNLFVSTDNAISIYNTKYGATHTTLAITGKPGLIADTALHKSLVFLGYMTEIDVAIGFNDHGCFAIQITRSGLFSGDTILDSLCKGVRTVDLDETVGTSKTTFALETKDQMRSRNKAPKHQKESKTRAALKILADLAAECDAFAFEKEFAEFVGLDRKTGAHAITKESNKRVSTNGTNHTNGDHVGATSPRLNGSSPANLKDEDLPEFLYRPPDEGEYEEPQVEQLSQSFVAAVLGMVFKPVFADSGALELELTMSIPNVFKFLLWEGYFSCSNLPAQGHGFVEALAKFDPELNLLLFFLENASNTALPLKEVVTGVKVIMTDLVRGAEAVAVPATEIDEMDLNEDSLDDEQLQRVTQQVEKALEQAQLQLDLSDVKEQILRASLLRVGRFSRSAIVRTLRETLNGAELAGLIRILRRELVRDADERDSLGLLTEEGDNVQDEEWLGLICDLLTDAIDAAGMTGLLLAKDTLIPSGLDATKPDQVSDEVEEFEREELLLESLSSEVSATCEALEGASEVSEALSHFLSRAEAYSAAMTYNSRPRKSIRPGDVRPTRQRKPDIVARERKKAAVLPMGYPPPVSRRKTSKPAADEKLREVRKNKYRQNLGVGAYSLERIEV